ncbi:MAG: hypothetical protein HRT89_04865 [Lentisphaeria bacterium]|nr:hypothetical protein [Lentisphaeria bacterium]NQZ67380.1 hypothetical protein [Lentisphaeria bacterium]
MSAKQRLLYLHSQTANVFSKILGFTLIEPVPGQEPEIIAEKLDWPYSTVHDAVCDGWHIVQFPNFQAPFDDEEIDMLGYEFILQKLETAE